FYCTLYITYIPPPLSSIFPYTTLFRSVVLECTGFYTSKAKSQAHIDAGAKKVIISAPAGNDLPTIVYSVNEKTLKPTDTIISARSEEHTSELQSRFDLVCRLLLEKKNT